jgi:hypothetical protein
MVFERRSGNDRLTVALNFSDRNLTAEGAEGAFKLKPWDYLIIKK